MISINYDAIPNHATRINNNPPRVSDVYLFLYSLIIVLIIWYQSCLSLEYSEIYLSLKAFISNLVYKTNMTL